MNMSVPRRTRSLALGVVLASLVLAACGSDDSGSDDAGPDAATGDAGADGADAGEEADGQPRVVVHELGEAEVPAAPERVVALDPYYSLPTALAAGANVVGASHQPFGESFPPYLDSAATADIEDVGWFTELDVEQIIQLEPDVIVGLTSFVEADYAQLSQIAPTVALSMDAMEWKQTAALVGHAIGRPDQVGQNLAAYEDRAEELAADLSDAGLTDEPVSLLNIRALDDLRVYTRSCAAAVLGDVGLTMHLDDETDDGANSVNLSIERLTDADAANLFYFVGSVGTNPEEAQAAYDQVADHPLWDQLAAVQDDQAHPVNAEWWFNCGSTQAAHQILDDVASSLLTS
ncbi:ABC transporter substrate-binding protein [Phytoactinopolyspora mesophila]|uniref:ABC transporter substrate-binding protein n=1 Tax=Phytoactinopolyspora mesophila TaxID=2650750 RepID=A0A7K3M0R3_9ACTN|nr:iron-siderophore ABC transporter substrate-binding protein [Phytoactinopolyspora mesophila]NDL56864.1 ABC transporter substrate-binding protein [Phytoactinopolyspora mesophila]